MKTLKLIKAAVLTAASTFTLIACDSNNSSAPFSNSKVRIVHAVPDAPMVQLSVDDVLLNDGAMYDYGQATPHARFVPGFYDIGVEAVLPSGMTVDAIGPVIDFEIEQNTNYDIFAVTSADNDTLIPYVMTRPEAFDESQARIDVAHLSKGAPAVRIFATAPGADLVTADPIATLSYLQELEQPLEVEPGDYQIRIVLDDDNTLEPIYDSGTVPLAAGDDLTVAAVTNTQVANSENPNSPVALLIANGDTVFTAYSVTDGAEIRVVHNSADAPAVDVLVEDNLDPFVPNLAFPDATPFVPAPAADLNVKVVVAGSTDLDAAVINQNVNLANGLSYTAIALNTVADIELLAVVDDPRRITGQAKLRVIHGAATVDDEQDLVDLYLTAVGAGIVDATPVATDFPFKANSGYLAIEPGTYDVTVTAADSMAAAIGPATITLEAGGIYTILARDVTGGGLGVTLLDDFEVVR